MKKRWYLAGSVVTIVLGWSLPAAAQTSPLDTIGDSFEESETQADPSSQGDADSSGSGGADSEDPLGGEGGQDSEMARREQELAKAMAEAKAVVDSGRIAEGIQAYSQILLATGGVYSPASLELGKLYADLDESELAIEAYKQVVPNDALNFPVASANIAELYLKKGLLPDAIDTLTAGIQSSPTDNKLQFLRGKALVRQGSQAGPQGGDAYFTAISSLSRAIEGDDTQADYFSERALAYAGIGDYDKAVADITKAVELAGTSPNNVGRKAILLADRAGGEINRYNANLEKAIADYRASLEACEAFLATEGKKTKDDYELDDLEAIKPSDILFQKAAIAVAMARELPEADRTMNYETAIADCDAAIAFNPNSPNLPRYLVQKAAALRLLGRDEEAIDTLTDSLKMAPNNGEALLRRGIIWLQKGEIVRARGDLLRAQQYQGNPPNGLVKFWLGLSYAKQGEYPQAVRLYSEALRENPEYKPAFNNRGLAYLQMGEFERAEEDFEELLARNRNDSVARQRRDLARQRAR